MSIGSAFGKVLDAGQGLFTGMGGKSIAKNLPMGIPAVYFGLNFGKQTIVDPIVESMQENPYGDAIQNAKRRYETQREGLRLKTQAENLQRRMMKASMQLAATDPHLYNEVMAGRSLPKDAVVFGGQARTDLMEELAMGMAQGQFEEQPTAQDELFKSLGV